MKFQLSHTLVGLLALTLGAGLGVNSVEAATLIPGSTLNLNGFVSFDNTPVVPPPGGTLLFQTTGGTFASVGSYGDFTSGANTGSFVGVTSGQILSLSPGTAPVDFLKFNAPNLVPSEVTFDLTAPLVYNFNDVIVNGAAYKDYFISADGVFQSSPNTNLGTGQLTLQFRIPSAGTDQQTSYSGTFVVGAPISVPEPAPFVGLLGLGLLGGVVVYRRRQATAIGA